MLYRRCVMLLVGSSALAHADPPPVSVPGEGLQLRAGLGFARYRENYSNGIELETDFEPVATLGGEWSSSLGRGQLAVEAAGTLGTDVALHDTYRANTYTFSDFRQELYEASPRLRWPVQPGVTIEGAYRLSFQRVFFLGAPGRPPQKIDIEQDVLVHAVELGASWYHDWTCSRLRISFGLGLNVGSDEYSDMPGDFSATGHSYWLAVQQRWASGFGLEFGWTYRQEHGSSEQPTSNTSEFAWPRSTTWMLMGAARYAF